MRRGAGGNGAATVHAPAQAPLSEEEIRLGRRRLRPVRGRRAARRPRRARVGAAQGRRLPARLRLDRPARPEPRAWSRRSAEHFELHPLAVEDAVHAHQRAKLEVHGGDTLFVVLKTARYVDSDELIEIGEVMVFLGERFVVTVRHGEGSPLHDVRLDLEAHPDLLGIGPSSVLYAIADRIVDDYLAVIDGIAVDLEEVEAEVFSGASSNPAERIYRLKREVLEFRRAVTPLIGPMQRLSSKQAGPAARPAHRGVLPRRPRPPAARRRAHRRLRRAAHQRPAGQRRADHDARQPGHAPHLGLGGDHRRADDGLRPLRHELQAHARAGVDLRLSGGRRRRCCAICAVLYRKFKHTGWL